MKRERCPKARRSSGANQRALLSSEAVLRLAVMGGPFVEDFGLSEARTRPRARRPSLPRGARSVTSALGVNTCLRFTMVQIAGGEHLAAPAGLGWWVNPQGA